MTVLRQSCAVFCANLGICDFGLIIKISGFAICGWHTLQSWRLCWFRIWQFADFGSNDADGYIFEKKLEMV
jgi:hypothetical protein